MYKRVKIFTILELIIVVSIISVLAAFLIPLLSDTESKALNDAEFDEMKKIQTAFIRLNQDCLLNDSELSECEKFGLWPLFQREHPLDSSKDLKAFDPERGKGWLGKYIAIEETRKINSTLDGQPESTAGTAVEVPVLKDPYGGYYRVLIPQGEAKIKLVVVCTGQDRELDTLSSSKNSDGNIESQGDDTVMRLLP
jgi:competence protein ComGC